jgi:dolichyl-phosphate-mannose--protein O-mannosyl transferase
MFAALITAAQFDSLSRTWHPRVRAALVAVLVAGVLASFLYLLPLIYGTEIEAEVLSKRKFIKAWNF